MDEQRTGWLLLLVLAAHLALLASGVPSASGEGTLLEQAGLRVIGPLARGTASVAELFGTSSERYAEREALLSENQQLNAQLEELRLEVLRLYNLEVENERLSLAMGHLRTSPGQLTIADIVYMDLTSWLSTLVLYTGTVNPRLNQPVLTVDGLVGRVVDVAGPYARVQLISDPTSSVGAMIVRTQQQGVVSGRGLSALELDYIPLQASVEEGDTVVTAGIDGVYPQGLPIGRVMEVKPGDDLFQYVRVAPQVDLTRLTHVYLLEGVGLPRELLDSGSLASP